ncbi:MAG: RNA pyrophosphohydrolase [Ilumatobacter coccineus]|uniref:RNA pyrophosphohydrolase n=1 Tax=Ilumatobacter coccineus TaxID=467094 RepID=A0A2G6K7X9_9ACTN|nr:MAG: RNA pyrophosphohydrolase [Ilumatobacter coccineus]
MAKAHFRAGVVAVVTRPDGAVMAFERTDTPNSWQLPQGGIEGDESPVDAVWRELGEETGLGPNEVRLTGEHPHWTVYEWPAGVASKGRRLGQAHRWFFFEPLQPDVEPHPDGYEFRDWTWMSPADLTAQVVEFRRQPYQQVFGV